MVWGIFKLVLNYKVKLILNERRVVEEVYFRYNCDSGFVIGSEVRVCGDLEIFFDGI